MFIPRVVTIAVDGAAEDLAFPNADAADELDYAFDFGPWLGPLDRVANAVVVPDAALTLGGVSTKASQVIARIGPTTTAGTYVIGCTVLTPQGRSKAVSAAVTLQ